MAKRNKAEAAILAAYAKIPQVNCQRKCQEACGPIMMSKSEQRRIENHVGRKVNFLNMETLTCPLLTPSGACGIYEQRPAICRMYGAVKMLACPHGCEPERWLTNEEAREILTGLGEK